VYTTIAFILTTEQQKALTDKIQVKTTSCQTVQADKKKRLRQNRDRLLFT